MAIDAANGRLSLPDDAKVRMLCEELGEICARNVAAAMQVIPTDQQSRIARELVTKQITVIGQMVTGATVRAVRKRGSETVLAQLLSGMGRQ